MPLILRVLSRLRPTRRDGVAIVPAVFVVLAAMWLSDTGAAERARSPRWEKLDKRVREAAYRGGHGKIRVIVQASEAARQARRLSLGAKGRWHGDHAIIDGMSVTVTAEELAELASDDSVLTVSEDATVGGQQTFTDGPLLRASLGLLPGGGIVSGGSSWAGDKIVVAVIDSGIQSSKDIDASRIVAFYDFTRDGIRTMPYDDYGHGTHVAGLIGGSGDLSSDRFEGAASKARFVGYKVLDRTGAGRTSDVIAAIEHAVTHRRLFGIKVLNLSLGHPIYESATTDPLVRAVERASAAGLVVVVSAGNNGERPGTGLPGYGGITSPANAPSAIAVGAIDTRGTPERADDDVQVFSSRGPSWVDGYAKPDIVAPGYRLVGSAATNSTLFLGNPSLRVAGNSAATPEYLRLSGTSMSAAVTTGIVAVMMEARAAKYPTRPLTSNLIKAVLQHTAIPVPGAHVLEQGAGSINPLGAIRLIEAINPSAPLGSYWLTKPVFPSDRYGRSLSAWSQTLVWGDRLLDGRVTEQQSAAWGTSLVWGDALVWGSRLSFTTRDTSIVWGDTLTWGSALCWGDHALGFSNGSAIVWGDALVWGSARPEDVRWMPLGQGIEGMTTAQVSLRY